MLYHLMITSSKEAPLFWMSNAIKTHSCHITSLSLSLCLSLSFLFLFVIPSSSWYDQRRPSSSGCEMQLKVLSHRQTKRGLSSCKRLISSCFLLMVIRSNATFHQITPKTILRRKVQTRPSKQCKFDIVHIQNVDPRGPWRPQDSQTHRAHQAHRPMQ